VKVLGDKNNTCADETNLRNGDRGKNERSHPVSSDGLSKVTVTTTILVAALEQQVESKHRDGRDRNQSKRGEQDTAVIECLGKEHDASTDEGLQECEEGFYHTSITLRCYS